MAIAPGIVAKYTVKNLGSRGALNFDRSEGFPRTGYFVPACVGSGRWADFESCSRIHACGFRCFLQKSTVSCKRGTHLLKKYGFVQKGPCGHVTAQKCNFQVQKSPCGHVTAQKCHFLGTKKAPAGMLLLRNAIFLVQKSPYWHVTAQKCQCLGTKKPLRACHCSEIQFFRYKKAPASLLRNAIF